MNPSKPSTKKLKRRRSDENATASSVDEDLPSSSAVSHRNKQVVLSCDGLLFCISVQKDGKQLVAELFKFALNENRFVSVSKSFLRGTFHFYSKSSSNNTLLIIGIRREPMSYYWNTCVILFYHGL